MFSVEVHSTIIQGEKITRYLIFETYSGAINCKATLESTREGITSPEDYFEAARVSREPVGEVVNRRSIETDWVLEYLHKTI